MPQYVSLADQGFYVPFQMLQQGMESRRRAKIDRERMAQDQSQFQTSAGLAERRVKTEEQQLPLQIDLAKANIARLGAEKAANDLQIDAATRKQKSQAGIARLMGGTWPGIKTSWDTIPEEERMAHMAAFAANDVLPEDMPAAIQALQTRGGYSAAQRPIPSVPGLTPSKFTTQAAGGEVTMEPTAQVQGGALQVPWQPVYGQAPGGGKPVQLGYVNPMSKTGQVVNPPNPTEVQQKAADQFHLSSLANAQYDTFKGDAVFSDPTARIWKNLPSEFRPTEVEGPMAAAGIFINAVLRRDSGAAITKDEFKNYGAAYFPLPGEGAEAVALKRKFRETAVHTLAASSGPMSGENLQSLQVPLSPSVGAPGANIPTVTDPSQLATIPDGTVVQLEGRPNEAYRKTAQGLVKVQ